MKRVILASVVVALASLVAATYSTRAAEDDKEEAKEAKYAIKQVMAQAHKQGLLKKVLTEEASDKEQKQLLDLYLSLAENKAPKGSQEEWHKKTGMVITAAAHVVVGREDGMALLKKATNCTACHKEHKPS